VHIAISMTVNEDTNWRWNEPKTQKDIEFSMPVAMFEAKRLTTLIEQAISDLTFEFPTRVVAFAKEQAEKEAEKIKADALEAAEAKTN
jgi:hypothetical protein